MSTKNKKTNYQYFFLFFLNQNYLHFFILIILINQGKLFVNGVHVVLQGFNIGYR